MSTLYGYKNKLWQVEQTFSYTGSPQQFVLTPGKYLLICKGAKSGLQTVPDGYPCARQYGGIAYGVLNNTITRTLYAYVGGDGGDVHNYTAGIGYGGWNGGADGTAGRYDGYWNGPGGGGATDIRTSTDTSECEIHETRYLPARYQRIEYIQSNGTQMIETGIRGSDKTCVIDMEIDDILSADKKIGFTSDDGNYIGFDTNGTFFVTTADASTGTYVGRHQIELIRNASTGEVTIVIDALETLTASVLTVIDVDDLVANHGYSWSNWAYFDSSGDGGTGWGNWIISPGIPVPPNSDIKYDFEPTTSGGYISMLTNPTSGHFGDAPAIYSTGTISWMNLTGSIYRMAANANYIRPQVRRSAGNDAGPRPTNVKLTLSGGNPFNESANFKLFGIDSSNRITAKLYGFHASNSTIGDIAILIPCIDTTTNVVGLYDICANAFIGSDGDAFTAGPNIEDTGTHVDINAGESVTLLSRFIVAGGAGGALIGMNNFEWQMDYSGMGGGVIGGPLSINPDYTGSYLKHATQNSGYSFGQGQVGSVPSGSTNYGDGGRPGGGGGWFGGYAFDSVGTYSNASGGGGSGYVLTESSYKPIGYQCGPELYLTDTFMSCGHADQSEILICKEVSSYSEGDTIIIPPTGETFHKQFLPGEYRLKCWGGSGGLRYSALNEVKGGYAEGILNLPTVDEVYCNTGGSGICDTCYSSTIAHQMRPEINFNGGGAPGVYGSYKPANGRSGGGASDIRIGSNSLYARVIVAGGSGGFGESAGGAGGGLTGGAATGSYGDNAGAGTQTETPHNSYSSQFPTIAGDFGYGGNAYNTGDGLTGYGGGAGGGGWFGGNGTYVTRNGTKGGSGGSGYVLTESSYKPAGYLLGSDYYLTNTVLTAGGNNLHYGETKIEIDVISVVNIKLLCRDEDGLKYFNGTAWTVIDAPLTPETFEEYGVVTLTTEAGLLDEYEVLVYDIDDMYTKAEYSVVPNKQTITQTTRSEMTVADSNMEYEYNPAEFDVSMSFVRNPDGPNTTIVTTVEMDKLDYDANSIPKIYYAQYINKK